VKSTDWSLDESDEVKLQLKCEQGKGSQARLICGKQKAIHLIKWGAFLHWTFEIESRNEQII
jgi:hypothetical protein